MPTLMTGESRGGSGIAEDNIIVDFDEPDWDVAAARLVQESKDGSVGGEPEPEVIGGRGFIPKEAGHFMIRSARIGAYAPNIGTNAIRPVVQNFRKTEGGWEAFSS